MSECISPDTSDGRTDGGLASVMTPRVGTLIWLLTAAGTCRSAGVPAIQTATMSAVTSSSDNSEPWTIAAAQTAADSTETTVEELADTAGDGRFCNQTISHTLKTDCKPCTMNAVLPCPDGLVQLTQVFLSHARNAMIAQFFATLLFTLNILI